jgi:long-chain fatty acid transport protein
MRQLGTICVGLVLCLTGLQSEARAQTFGIELHNTLMPASGGMGGVSIARPQDLTSAINGNPASLTQFRGTQFIFGGAWAEPTVNMDQSRAIAPFPAPVPVVDRGFRRGHTGAQQHRLVR